ncbi:chemotaxis protein CheW [Kineosporia sp. J2-2]|uniref:Chemotaxis protein CheW n=1 Tax=Kineosporia corallincola TaxID=2835133 RepID=A0ABS5THK8_9ACTN|nr:chemotaxis protein CheW [Kineosporia corallincola]MBT0770580.1 chemotaxis protein CheW [Kineosporia corallincola]
MNTTYGLFASGDACVGVPLADVREVTPCPDRLEVLPVTAPGLLGAVNLRGQVIPVLDLLAIEGRAEKPSGEAESGPRRVIVVLLHENQLLGLIVDGVHGVTRPGAMTRMGTSDGSDLLVSHTFARPETGNIVSVIDVDAMFALPGVPVVREEGRADGVFAGGDPSAGSGGGAGAAMLLVRCADHRLAIAIESVHTILPRVRVRNSPLRHGSCKGVTDYDGTEIPVFDPLELAGLGTLSRTGGEESEGVAIRFRDGLVVMMLSEVLELINVGAVERFPLPAVQVPGRRYLDEVLRVPGHGDFLSLAVPAMLEHDDLKALSRLNTPHENTVPAQRSEGSGGAAGDSWDGAGASGDTYLTFAVTRTGAKDKEFAVPLREVVEILEFPERYSVLEAGHDQMLGLFTHRDTVVPLYRLSRLLGVPDSPLESAYVLVVSTDPDSTSGQVAGLVVHGLRAIERAVWQDPNPKRSGHPDGSLEAALNDVTMLRVAAIGTADEPRMLARLDLSAIGAALVPALSSSSSTWVAA